MPVVLTDYYKQGRQWLRGKTRISLNYLALCGAQIRRIQPPLLATELPDFENINSRLGDKFRAMAGTEPGVISNSPGGAYFENKWLSKNDLYPSEDADLIALSNFIETFANHSLGIEAESRIGIATMWCIVSRDGLRGMPHCHRGKVSGVYYVDAGDTDETTSGAIAFFPRWGRTLGQQSLFGRSVWGEPLWPSAQRWNADIARYHQGVAMVKPCSGLLLLFPAHLLHCVHRYVGQRKRIVVSFNLR